MDAVKFFVNREGNVIVECPQCENSKTISVASFKGKEFAVKVKCVCGHIFPISLDFREHYRKPTFLEGNYRKTNLNLESFYEKIPRTTNIPSHQKRNVIHNCSIKDISVGGLGVDIWGEHKIEVGNHLFIEFILDNKKRSLVRCELIVKTVSVGGSVLLDWLENNRLPDKINQIRLVRITGV